MPVTVCCLLAPQSVARQALARRRAWISRLTQASSHRWQNMEAAHRLQAAFLVAVVAGRLTMSTLVDL